VEYVVLISYARFIVRNRMGYFNDNANITAYWLFNGIITYYMQSYMYNAVNYIRFHMMESRITHVVLPLHARLTNNLIAYVVINHL
jgi:hypothetical protein